MPPPWSHDALELKRIEDSPFPFGIAEGDYDGKEVPAVIVRFLSEDDLDILHEVHLRVVGTISHPHVYRADDREFMAAHLARRGRTLGVFHYRELVGYAAISFPKGDPDNLGELAPIAETERERVAHFDGSGILDTYRGNNLQTLLNQIRGDYAVAAGYRHLMATVSPMNPYSLVNLLATGFHIVNFAVKYGGMDRLVVYRNGDIPVGEGEPEIENPEIVRLADRDGLQRLLDQGFVGQAMRQEDGEFSVVFSKIGR